MILKDIFERTIIEAPDVPLKCDKCLFTLFSPGYEDLLDDMLLSVVNKGKIHDAEICIFVVNPNNKCLSIIEKYNAHAIKCYTSTANIGIDIKMLVYSIHKIVDANKYIFLDADLLVLDSLQPLFDSIDDFPKDDCLGICSDQYFAWTNNFVSAYNGSLYGGKTKELKKLLGDRFDLIENYPHIVNTGVMIGTKKSFAKLYDTILSIPGLVEWSTTGFLREQIIVNIALALEKNEYILDQSYNRQLAIRTVLSYELTGKDVDSVGVGYFPFFLDYLSDPVSIIEKLSDPDDEMSIRLLDKSPDPTQQHIIKHLLEQNLSTSEYSCALENFFNPLIMSSVLFNDDFLSQFGDLFKDITFKGLKNLYDIINVNKQVIFLYYMSEYLRIEDNKENYGIVKILHFNGLNKNWQNVREYLKNNMLGVKKDIVSNTGSGIKFIISTHKNYQEKTLPSLLESMLELNNIPPSYILVVSGGWDEEKKYVENGVNYCCVTHNSFDHTGLIYIVENNIQCDYWFLLHDTCVLGPEFYTKLLKFDKKYDYVMVDGQGYLNIGLFSWKYLIEIQRYIISLKNCNKKIATLSEKMYVYAGDTTNFGDEWLIFIGYADVYKTGVFRNILYYPSIDIYKYQANIEENLGICNA